MGLVACFCANKFRTSQKRIQKCDAALYWFTIVSTTIRRWPVDTSG
jgi:hypothetical protein